MSNDRKVTVTSYWEQAIYILSAEEYNQIKEKQNQIMISYSHEQQKLDDWSNLTRAQVLEQLRIRGIRRPRSSEWYLDPNSKDYLPPSAQARILFREWRAKKKARKKSLLKKKE